MLSAVHVKVFSIQAANPQIIILLYIPSNSPVIRSVFRFNGSSTFAPQYPHVNVLWLILSLTQRNEVRHGFILFYPK